MAFLLYPLMNVHKLFFEVVSEGIADGWERRLMSLLAPAAEWDDKPVPITCWPPVLGEGEPLQREGQPVDGWTCCPVPVSPHNRTLVGHTDSMGNRGEKNLFSPGAPPGSQYRRHGAFSFSFPESLPVYLESN